ncbi:GNAT family N-acetyltransferase [Amycolatopsis sp., V23-08]|uniref:GNAT family N-acetyltransferase n=1 Tax=Amycolatopsis heterodermiae TaxID=3110235 RepID=A0ABU5RK71_9PSEU|nr:GNAT family N-acetyltransferase [Amycolatopsis sp., V23-08]MEA5366691.1 GNAT family N-acetyltransferase [Amycolatopsis sp., V23-08]
MTEPHVGRARSADLIPFATALDDDGFLTDRLARQDNHQGVLFFGWWGTRPAGTVYLWLEEAEEPPIQAHLPGVALLTHLQVHAELRRRGVGTALVGAVEQHLAEQGRERVALAVRTDNPAAARLYDKLGYRDWGHGTVTCYARVTLRNGGVLEVPELCHVLVKDLEVVTPAPRAEPRIGASRRC